MPETAFTHTALTVLANFHFDTSDADSGTDTNMKRKRDLSIKKGPMRGLKKIA